MSAVGHNRIALLRDKDVVSRQRWAGTASVGGMYLLFL